MAVYACLCRFLRPARTWGMRLWPAARRAVCPPWLWPVTAMPARFVLRSGVFSLALVLLTSLPSSPVAAARGVLLRFGPNHQLSEINEEQNQVESNGRVAARFSVDVSTLGGDPAQNVLIDWTVENGAGGSGAENVEVHATRTDAQGKSRVELTSKTAGTFVVKAAWEAKVKERSVEFVESEPLFFEESRIEYFSDAYGQEKLGQKVQGGHQGGAVTYSSSDPAIASFSDDKNSAITLNKAGTVVITATEQGTAQYSGQNARYFLEVSSESPDYTFHVDCNEVISLGKQRVHVKGQPGSSVIWTINGGPEQSKTLPDYGSFHFDFVADSPDKTIKIEVEMQDGASQTPQKTTKEVIVRPYTLHARPVIYEDGTVGAKITADKLENFGHYECPVNWNPSQDNAEKCEKEIRMSSGKYPEIEVTPEYKVLPKAKKIVVSETEVDCINFSDTLSPKGPACNKLRIENVVQVPVEDRANLQLSLYWPGKDAAAKSIPLFSDSKEEYDCGSHISEIMYSMVNMDADKLQRWEIAPLGTSCRVPCFKSALEHSFEMLDGVIETECRQIHKAAKEDKSRHTSHSEMANSDSAMLNKAVSPLSDKKQSASFSFGLESFELFPAPEVEIEKKFSNEGFFEFKTKKSGRPDYSQVSGFVFYINDINDVDKFFLAKVYVDDEVDFFVNGVLVLRVLGKSLYFHKSLNEQFQCVVGGATNDFPVNLDVTPYLKNGANSMQVTHFFATSGSWSFQIHAEPCDVKAITVP